MPTIQGNQTDFELSRITVYLTPENEIQISSWVSAGFTPTINCQDRDSLIKSHIDQFSDAWKELAKL